MLDAIGTILFLTFAAVALVSVTKSRLLAGIAGAYFGIAVVVAATGAFDGGQFGPLVLLILFALPLVAAAVAWQRPALREAMLSIPTSTLIRLNAFRAVGVLFLLLAAQGRLSGPFPYSAGLGDIITGVLAFPVARAASSRLTAAWNAFGTLDLIAAVTLGVISANGSPVQLLHVGVGSLAITHLPWSLVPTVFVPFFMVTHAIIFAQLRAPAPRPVSAVVMPA